MAGSPTHGREGVLSLSTTAGSTGSGTEIGWINDWTWTPSKENTEISKLNATSKYFLEGLVSGTVSASGSFVSAEASQRVLAGRYAKVMYDSYGTTGDATKTTDAAAITDGKLYMHLVAKPIDTGASSGNVNGQKFVVPILASGFSIGAAGADVVGFSFDGQQDGDAYYVESTSTGSGIPLKET